jgi:hypothetical protein
MSLSGFDGPQEVGGEQSAECEGQRVGRYATPCGEEAVSGQLSAILAVELRSAKLIAER